MLKIAIAGATGRMGLSLIRELSTHPRLELVACGIRAGTRSLAENHLEQAGLNFARGFLVEQPRELVAAADAVIDFTRPEYTMELAALATAQGRILVSGTTGFSADEKEKLIHAGARARVLWAANMSVGVNVLMALVQQAAKTLSAGYDIEILEMHHKHKVDAPSGTALALGEAAARGRGIDLHDVWVKQRDGHTGARKEGQIGFATLRGGSVIGEHDVLFAAEGERLVLRHEATDRKIFAQGALKAAEWLASKPNGFYTMQDMVA